MKKLFNIILTAALMMAVALPASAQDQRQRTPETIVQDVLAQMPAQDKESFNREMGYLAQSAPQSVILLCKMMQPAEKACNNRVEYAISGVVNYATENVKFSKAVKEGLEKAIPDAVDKTAKQFFEQELRLFNSENDVTYGEHTGAETYTAAYDKLKGLGDKAGKQIVKSIKSKDHALRMQALKYATDNGLVTDELVKKVAGKYNSTSTEGKVDILNWLGDNKIESQKSLMMKAVEKGGEPAAAAIEALSRLGGDDALDVLIGQLGTANNDAAFTALRSFPGNIGDKVVSSLGTATGDQQISLLNLASARRITGAASQMFDLTSNNNAAVSQAALQNLAGVVGAGDASKIASMLDKATAAQVPSYQKMLASSLKSLEAKKQFDTISSLIKGASNKERLYPALAATNTDESVNMLQQAWENAKSADALNALKSSQNYKAANALFNAAKGGDEEALKSFVSLVDNNESNVDSRFNRLEQAINIAKSADAKKNILGSLGNTPTRSAFKLAGKYLDDKEVGYEAAVAEKKIISKAMDDIEYDLVKTNLNKCIDLYKAHGTADDGYAVDEIKKMLAETEPSPIYVLTDEEKAEGYELLFDGTNLDNFVGNKENYVPINGSIYVTADYGSGGNLYTAKEYRDFVFRFEFCFMRPGVNNGIGVRTPMGVDAAYDGMCECQILDHDDPIYKDLREYQVHGSVYGVIPAKRIKHKPLGEWSTEEIRVQGNHITVIVNGEVINDGDIKEACQGHNVAPDGSGTNPYTVDHRNHPGMFNKTGHIGFLGHGTGIKFRNVRVLDLTKQKAKGKKK